MDEPRHKRLTVAERLEPLNSSRLLFKIIVLVLGAILVIELILLFPGARRFRNETINRTKLGVAINLLPLTTQHLVRMEEGLRRCQEQLAGTGDPQAVSLEGGPLTRSELCALHPRFEQVWSDHASQMRDVLTALREREMDKNLTITVRGADMLPIASTDPEIEENPERPVPPFNSIEYFADSSNVQNWQTPEDFWFPIKDGNGRLIGLLEVSRPPDVFFNTDVAQYMSRTITLVVIIMLFVGVTTVGFLYRIVVRPLQRLLRADEAGSRNDETRMFVPDAEIPDDEIGDIMRSRNLLLRRLRETQRQLEAWSQELEAKVAEKTTELRRAQQQLIHREKLAAMGQLAAGVAHEINNPLATIAAHAEDLLDQLTELRQDEILKEFPDALRIIEEQAYRCKRITKQLLNFARETELQMDNVDVNAALRDTVPLVRTHMSEADVQLTLDLGDDMPLVETDRHRLQQVIVNLLTNAMDASAGGQVALRTRTETDAVVIDVADDGPGIPPDVRDRVFDPFFTTKPVGQGTGLGLSICYGIISSLGGEITFTCPAGGGTVFTVRLPLIRETAVTEAHVPTLT